MLTISESGILEKGVTFCIIKCIIFAFTFTFRLQSPSLLEKSFIVSVVKTFLVPVITTDTI
jgi:hypothetical protein